MKNTLLWSALFTVMCGSVQADVTQTTTTTAQPVTNQGTATPTSTIQSAPQTGTQPTVQQPTKFPTAQTAQPVNCDYKIPAETKVIDQSLVSTWSENATVQAFNFEPQSIDSQMHDLQKCFTDQGWMSFTEALQKSGNIEAIKTQNLTVSSQVDGQLQISQSQDNQWKITLPLQVVYQNDKEKVTQLLNINLLVGRKVTGELGIMQMIAAPRTIVSTTPQTTTTTTTTTAPTVTKTPNPTTTTVPAEIDATKVQTPSSTDAGASTTTPTTVTPTNNGTTPSNDATKATPTEATTTTPQGATTVPADTGTATQPSTTTTTVPTNTQNTNP